MTNFKCTDYHIIKVRIYASKYLLAKHYNDDNNNNKPLPKQHWERAQQYTKFFWQFFTYVTGINNKDWYSKYMFDARECAFEELQDKYGILSSDAEAERIFLIPKGKEDILEWVKNNVELPYKIVSKIPVPFKFYHDNFGLGNIRQEAEENTKKIKEKHGIKDGEE